MIVTVAAPIARIFIQPASLSIPLVVFVILVQGKLVFSPLIFAGILAGFSMAEPLVRKVLAPRERQVAILTFSVHVYLPLLELFYQMEPCAENAMKDKCRMVKDNGAKGKNKQCGSYDGQNSVRFAEHQNGV